MSRTEATEDFNCGRHKTAYYQLNTDPCPSHFIKRKVLEAIVLDDLRKLITFATEREAEFVASMEKQTQKERASAARKAKTTHDKNAARIGEIDRIIKRLYEDRASNILPSERFFKMLSEYETEQKALTEAVEKLKADMTAEAERASRAGKFLALVKRFTNVEELTPEIAAVFINKVYIDKCERGKQRSVTIEYNIIGKLE